jgi:hypothetical protein
VQLVLLTDVTFTELNKIQSGAGTPEDKQRAMAVLLTQLMVTSGLTALSVQGARSARALAGQPLEVIEQNGVKVLRVVGEDTRAPAGESQTVAKGSEKGTTFETPTSTETKTTGSVTNRAPVTEPPWNEGDPLPKSSEAIIDRAKFEKYSMAPTNKENGGKAIAFKTIGYDVDAEVGRQTGASDIIGQLKSQLGATPAIKGKSTGFGQRFEVRVQIKGPSGDGTLVTVWQIESGRPRMITNWLEVHI